MKEIDYWKENASSFASIYGDGGIVFRFLQARTIKLLRMIDLRPDMSVLDVGCGSGEHMALLRGKVEFIAGVDISKQMLGLAEKMLRDGKNNWELHQCSADVIPYPDTNFDLVISMGLLDYVPSIGDVLTELKRVLKDDGTIVVTIPKSPSLFSPLRTAPGNLIKRLIFDLPPVANVWSLSDVLSTFGAKGFTVEQIQSVWTTMWLIKATRGEKTETGRKQ